MSTKGSTFDARIRAAAARSDRTTAVEARDRPAPIPRWLRQRFDRARERERWRG